MSSNVLALFQGGVPAHLQGEKDALTSKIAGGPGGIKRISIRGMVWRLMDGSQEIAVRDERHLDMVVVAAGSITRTYYEGQYSEDSKTAPVCWSKDGKLPDAEVAAPLSKSCATCPKSVKNVEGRTPCRFSQRLAVALPNDTDSESVYQLSVPAASLFGKEETQHGAALQHFGRQLAGHNVPVGAVVTRATFDIRSATPKLMFKAVSALSAEDFGFYKELGTSADAERAVEFSVYQADGGEVAEGEVAQPAPSPAPAARKTRTAQAPVAAPAPAVAESVEVEEVEVIAPPTVRRAAATPPPAETTGLADVLDEWGDD